MKKKILSCIQPTGHLHFGNYFGAIKNWVHLQEENECIYGVVDYHAMTMPFDPSQLRQNSIQMIRYLISCGLDPNKATLFIQSMVPEHTELAWIFNCICSYGELARMTQFKDKGENLDSQKQVTTGLFTYPVLQAADILIYNATHVPVGKDQVQHLELSRTIANRFNNRYGNFFNEPQALLAEIPKIQSLADPTKKMSKSLGSKHFIGLFEDEKTIRKKVKSAVTSNTVGEIMDPGVQNLFGLLKANGAYETHDSLMKEYNSGSLRYSDLKEEVSTMLIALSAKFKSSLKEIERDEKYLEEILDESAERCRSEAIATLKEVKKRLGLRK
jgi:tryptophanyl-tRNA synthetase